MISNYIYSQSFPCTLITASKSSGTILDCGVSSHLTSEHTKLLNYREIGPEPIQATDGHTFSATGKGNPKLELPNGDQKLTPVTLKNVYYSPHLAFTLMSVGTMDHNGYDLSIKEKKGIIKSPKSILLDKYHSSMDLLQNHQNLLFQLLQTILQRKCLLANSIKKWDM